MTAARPVLAAAALALLAPAAANAATLAVSQPCYYPQQQLLANGTGWGPGSSWSIKTTDPSNQVFDYGTADAAGNFASTAEVAPLIDIDAVKPKTFTLTGQQDQQDVASTTFQVANLLVKLKKEDGKPTKSTRWSFSGFIPGQPVYVHVRRKGKTYTQRAGVASAPCGTLTKRMRRLPAWPKRRIAYGTYKLAIDNNKRYRKSDKSFPQFTAEVTIYRKYV